MQNDLVEVIRTAVDAAARKKMNGATICLTHNSMTSRPIGRRRTLDTPKPP
jgi:hypothetical protein